MEERAIRFKQFFDTVVVDTSVRALADQFVAHNIAQGNSHTTITTRKTHVQQFAKFCEEVGLPDVSMLTNQFIDQYFLEYGKTHSEGTVNTDKRILKAFLTWIQDYKEVPMRCNPGIIKSKKMKYRVPKAIDVETIRLVIKMCRNEQDKMIIAMLIETGIRASEMCKIRVMDVYGEEIVTIKDLLGHEYITTTQQYLRLTNKQRKESYDKALGGSFYS